jgi:flagellar L-ring protein precursor FlgH
MISRCLRILASLTLVVRATTAHAQAAPAEPADSASDAPATPKPVRQSWTSDRRAVVAGDVITVLVDEYTLASAGLGNTSSDNRRRSSDFGIGMKTAAGGTTMGANLSSNSLGDQTQRGEATRQNRFTSEMTVRVTEVLPNGVLKVEGKKLVNVDANKQEVTLSGLVRPQDVSAYNQIESSRLGELNLLYKNDGAMGKPKGGLVWKLFGWLWP